MTNERRRTIRTAFQTLSALPAAVIAIAAVPGVEGAVAGVGTVAAWATIAARVMALPEVERLLPGWLRQEPPGSSDG